MKFKIVVHPCLLNPLTKPASQFHLERILVGCDSFDVAYKKLRMNGYTGLYRGGAHIAIHPTHNGLMVGGSDRWALITEER